MVSVSSDLSEYTCVVATPNRDDYNRYKSVVDSGSNPLSHSRSPAALINSSTRRCIQVCEVYNNQKDLVGFFPFETREFMGCTFIRPAFYELTLDFIDIASLPGYEKEVVRAFFNWAKTLGNLAVDIFMCHENSQIVSNSSSIEGIIKVRRGDYYFTELPTTLEDFFSSLSRTTKISTKRVFKKYSNEYRYEVIDDNSLAEVLEDSLKQFEFLHLCRFPNDSLMIQHKNELFNWIKLAIADGVVVLTRVIEISTGKVVACDVLARSNTHVGLIQGGRRVEEKYSGLGVFLMAKNIEWAIENSKVRFEYLFGKQEHKRRLSNGFNGAYSLTCFSSTYAKLIYRLYQRLGRYFKSLR